MLMASAAFFSEANLSSGEREDRSNRWIFLSLLVIGLLSAFLPAYTERKGWWLLGGDTVRWIGVFLYVAGGALRIRPIFVLGRRFSGLVAIQRNRSTKSFSAYFANSSLNLFFVASCQRVFRCPSESQYTFAFCGVIFDPSIEVGANSFSIGLWIHNANVSIGSYDISSISL